MEKIICKNCGSNQFDEIDGYLVCKFCGTKYVGDDKHSQCSTTISIENDIKNLLDKCKSDPLNAQRYANLVLDIDSNNSEAKNILKGNK